MPPLPTVYLVNQSRFVSPAQAALIAAVLNLQVSRDFLPSGPSSGCTVVIAPGSGAPAGEATLNFLDSTPPGDENALGEHHENEDDSTVMNILCGVIMSQTNATVTQGPVSISAVSSHELMEWLGDSTANLFAMNADGTSYAREMCDAVESNSYDVSVDGGAVTASDFVLPPFFDPAGKGPYSFVDRLTGKATVGAPFMTAPGGYQIYEAPEDIQQTTAARRVIRERLTESHARFGIEYGEGYPSWRKEMREHSRRRRQMRRVAARLAAGR